MSSGGNAAASPIRGAVRLLPLNPIIVVSATNFSSKKTLNAVHIRHAGTILGHISVTILIISKAVKVASIRGGLMSLFRRGGVPCLVIFGGYSLFSGAASNRVYMDTGGGAGVRLLGSGVTGIMGTRGSSGELYNSLIGGGSFIILMVPVSSTTPGNEVVLPRRRIVHSLLSDKTVPIYIHRDRLTSALGGLNAGPGLIVASDRMFGPISRVIPGSVGLASFSVLVTECGKFLGATMGNTETVRSLGSNSGVLVDRNYARRERYSSVNAMGLPQLLEGCANGGFRVVADSNGSFPGGLSRFSLTVRYNTYVLGSERVVDQVGHSVRDKIPFAGCKVTVTCVHKVLGHSVRVFSM